MLVNIAPALETATGSLASHRIENMPVLVLDLHSRCNCRCVMCDIWKRESHHELPYESLARNVESFRSLNVEWVVLTGGEPLMHSRFEDICRLFRREDIRITLLTAGMTLPKHAAMVAYNVDDVIVSLDGPPKVHDSIRGVKGAFNLLATGVLSLLSLRPEMRIAARTTIQRSNHTALRATVEAAQELDLSGISFLAADVSSSAFNRDKGWSPEKQETVALRRAEVVALDREISQLIVECGREFSSGYIAETPAKLRRIVDVFRARLGDVSHQAPMCNAPWVSAVVAHDGSVQPCFFHPAVGTLENSALSEVVNGVSALTFRRSLDVARNPTCERCVCSLYRKNGVRA